MAATAPNDSGDEKLHDSGTEKLLDPDSIVVHCTDNKEVQ
jgi:hypothetical protein